jgi:YidC/Oxa1 family membrane protein insertase
MGVWVQIVEVLRESMLAYAQVSNGNLGYGILIVTFLARMALLPLTLRLTKAAGAHQRAMARLQPMLEALRRKYRNDPRRLAEETQRLMAREGVSPRPLSGCVGALVQLPVFIALYSAVRDVSACGGRFLWVRDLARPDALIVLIATGATVAASAVGPALSPSQRSVMLLATALVTAAALSQMAAGIGLYWSLSSLFGTAQGWLAQRGTVSQRGTSR